MDEADLELRNLIYEGFVETAQPPRLDELGLPRDEAAAALRHLHDAHALVLERDADAIRMLNPFSCVPSAWRVHADGRTWYANCAWDAFGVLAALHEDGRISASCADCGEPFEIAVRNERSDPDDLLFHVLVPAAQWWDDIVFT